MEKGLYDLENLMESWEYPFSEHAVRVIGRGILNGLQHLHSQGIGHRDRKPSNVVVKQSKEDIIICDFGSATRITPGK